MTADIKARVVATDRLVVNFKCSPCGVMGSLRRQIVAQLWLCTHLLVWSSLYYAMHQLILVSDNTNYFFKSAITLSHLLSGTR